MRQRSRLTARRGNHQKKNKMIAPVDIPPIASLQYWSATATIPPTTAAIPYAMRARRTTLNNVFTFGNLPQPGPSRRKTGAEGHERLNEGCRLLAGLDRLVEAVDRRWDLLHDVAKERLGDSRRMQRARTELRLTLPAEHVTGLCGLLEGELGHGGGDLVVASLVGVLVDGGAGDVGVAVVEGPGNVQESGERWGTLRN